jgi:hypothetical protein
MPMMSNGLSGIVVHDVAAPFISTIVQWFDAATRVGPMRVGRMIVEKPSTSRSRSAE